MSKNKPWIKDGCAAIDFQAYDGRCNLLGDGIYGTFYPYENDWEGNPDKIGIYCSGRDKKPVSPPFWHGKTFGKTGYFLKWNDTQSCKDAGFWDRNKHRSCYGGRGKWDSACRTDICYSVDWTGGDARVCERKPWFWKPGCIRSWDNRNCVF